MTTDSTSKISKRQRERRLFFGTLILIVLGCITAALFFGETSPIIAEGRVILSPELEAKAQGLRTLFLIVRDPSSPMPMPYGAMKTTLSGDAKGEVLSFKLTKDNLRIMSASAEHPQKITVKARLDIKGLGGADSPGDIVGSVDNIDWGSRNITITLNRLIPGQVEAPTP